MVDQKPSLRTLKGIKIIQSMVSNNNGVKLEINNRSKSGKSPNIWASTHFSSTLGSKEKTTGEIRKYLNWMKMKKGHITI